MTEPLEVLRWEDPRTVLHRRGLWAKRAFSQNFLVAKPIVERIAEAARASGGGIIELGPGLGTLTKALLADGRPVIAIERDRDMIELLREELASVPSLRVIEADAASVCLTELAATLPQPVTLVGNLPYAITGSIFRNVVDQAASVPTAVFMVQREVRDRLQAPPAGHEYGKLTVFVGARFDITTLVHVGRNCFHPPPNVNSSVVVLRRRDVPRAELSDGFRRVVTAAFGARRKTLRNALMQAGYPAAGVDAALEACGIEPRARGETLSIEQFGALAAALACSS